MLAAKKTSLSIKSQWRARFSWSEQTPKALQPSHGEWLCQKDLINNDWTLASIIRPYERDDHSKSETWSFVLLTFAIKAPMALHLAMLHWHCTELKMLNRQHFLQNGPRPTSLQKKIRETDGNLAEPMPMQKSRISQRGASSEPGKQEATGQVLSGFWIQLMQLIGKCVISAWTWVLAFIPWTVRNIDSHAEIMHFCTPLFCMNCVLVMGLISSNKP